MEDKKRPVVSRHGFTEMTDAEFAREFFIPEESDDNDVLPRDDEDYPAEEENRWTGQ